MSLSDEHDPLVGASIGNYRVSGLLGRGGMGTVYRAEHPEIGRQVAIKVVSAQFAVEPAVMARFKAEALAVNRIGHPHIIDISDFGALPDGRPYFVMEYLDGEDLGHRLRRQPVLPHAAAAPILRQTLDALAAAHAEQIIHRDLKPDNIYLARRRDGVEVVKLLDFGIAKLRVGNNVGATSDGTLLGTPLYMSPEQAMGRMSEIGPASDVYSFGVILYQLFTGQLPFVYESFGELLVAHAQEPPPRPSSKLPAIDARLEPIILRCLEKKPADRFPSAEALRDALLSVIPEMAETAPATRPHPAATPSGTQPVAGQTVPRTIIRDPVRAAQRAVAAAVAAGVLLGVCGGAFIYWRSKGPEPRTATELPPPPMPGPLLEGRER